MCREVDGHRKRDRSRPDEPDCNNQNSEASLGDSPPNRSAGASPFAGERVKVTGYKTTDGTRLMGTGERGQR